MNNPASSVVTGDQGAGPLCCLVPQRRSLPGWLRAAHWCRKRLTLGHVLVPIRAVLDDSYLRPGRCLLGALSAALVGTASAAAQSVRAGWLAGGGSSLALGLILLAAACLAPATPPPFGPGRPINPAADADEERTLEQEYLKWKAEQDAGERGGFIIVFAVPATLCAFASAWGASRRLRSRHPEWARGAGRQLSD